MSMCGREIKPGYEHDNGLTVTCLECVLDADDGGPVDEMAPK